MKCQYSNGGEDTINEIDVDRGVGMVGLVEGVLILWVR